MVTGRIIGVDVGGTFTDLVTWDGWKVTTVKVPTTFDQSEAVVRGSQELAQSFDAFLHGTTTATNALLERAGARTLLVTSPGFQDVIEIGRQDRPSLYDPFADRPEPLVGRADRIVDLDDAEPAAYQAVAVSLLYSYDDPGQEQALRQQILDAAPDVAVSLSSDVAPEFREFERTSTTVLNAYLQPVVATYFERLEQQVKAAGIAERVGVMRSSGGLITTEQAARLPAAILLSGPAGGSVAAAALATAFGRDQVVSFDMGGTSTDVCRIDGGRPEISYERAVAGYACRMPSIAIHTVGAGGGSIGWVDPGGALRVGPHSAGADPGPACYRKGGGDATVTDANVVLGRIAPRAALGGRLEIDRELAEQAVARLGEDAGLSRHETALGMVRVVEEVMTGAVRSVSIEQGVDPRGGWLVAFGGAGGLHATALARSLDMRGVVVPAHAGVFSALGLLLSPPRVDEASSLLLVSGDHALHREVALVAAEAAQRLPGGTVTTMVDVRYLGQSHEITVPFQADDGWQRLADRFHAAHLERYGFHRQEDPIEAVTVRAEAVGTSWFTFDELPRWQAHGDAGAATRTVLTDDGPVDTSVWIRSGLEIGAEIVGPAIIEERDATTWVGQGERAEVHRTGALEITW
ncbi:MAG: hydantoinase/oxoprolinase family protein [Acidimicrobiia bacterium]|nr:MAG: hydantoinase/oxoprolinase family protein [Acidimicrobiia bacterium]